MEKVIQVSELIHRFLSCRLLVCMSRNYSTKVNLGQYSLEGWNCYVQGVRFQGVIKCGNILDSFQK